MASSLQPECVSAETKHWGRCVPVLDLFGDVLLPFRVYVLRCAPRHAGGPSTLYVGVEHSSHIARRVQSHFAQRAAHFTLAHKPMDVAVVWPVASRAAEAYVFYALMESLPLCSVESGRLGGWTQTQSDPSRLQTFMLQRDWRMLTRRCLDCGSPQHWAGDSQCVPKALAYTCNSCGSTVRVRRRRARAQLRHHPQPRQPRPPQPPHPCQLRHREGTSGLAARATAARILARKSLRARVHVAGMVLGKGQPLPQGLPPSSCDLRQECPRAPERRC